MPSTLLVNTLGLNLRSSPDSSDRHNIIAVLENGHPVTDLQSPDIGPPWMHIRTTISGQETEGYVHSTFLTKKQQLPAVTLHRDVTAIHMTENKPEITRQSGSRAFPIGEPDRPSRIAGSDVQAIQSHHAILDWLDVEHSERYKPNSSYTYCNIYAYDFCYLSGAYLPRVWWKDDALCKLWHRQESPAEYGSTVHELNANSLFDWLVHFGPDFGWKRSFDAHSLQSEANAGKVAIICAKRKNINYSGHICMVVPETDSRKAKREVNLVTAPLQSQAGSSNQKYFTFKWWTHGRFQDFAFWVHE